MNRRETADFLDNRLRAVFGFCLKRCACPQDAEDLAQDILLRALERLQDAEDVPDPERYLWTIARHSLVNYYRRRSRTGPPEMPSEEDTPLSGLLAREETAQLQQEIARLARQQREILVAHYFHREKQSDIADRLGLPEGTVKWHLHEARKELKHHMIQPTPINRLICDPVRFVRFSTEGSTGTEGAPSRLFRALLPQNIAYATWKQALTIDEIAQALGMPPVYIEDLVDHMADMGYLLQEGRRYRCGILMTELTDALISLEDAMFSEAAALIGPALLAAIRDAELPRMSCFYAGEGGAEAALWTLIPYALSLQSAPEGSVSFRDAATIRPDGACNLCHALIAAPDVHPPMHQDLMERISGPCWNERNGVTLWQMDTAWSDTTIDEGYQQRADWLLGLLERMFVRGDALSEDEYALLARHGLIRTEGDAEGLFRATLRPVWLQGSEVKQRLAEIVRSVMEAHAAALERISAPCTRAVSEGTPAHLLRQRRYTLQQLWQSDRFLVHVLKHLADAGLLKEPEADRRNCLHTLIITP